MKKLILTFTLICAGFLTVSAQYTKDGGPAVASPVCGPAIVTEADLGLTAKGYSDSGCTAIHAREFADFQWYIYGLRLTGQPSNPSSGSSPDICGPVTFSQFQVGLRVKGIAEDQGCTEIHVREVSANVWTAYGVRLITF